MDTHLGSINPQVRRAKGQPINEEQRPVKYRVSPHVYLCALGEQVIALDLRRDKYFAFARSEADELGRVVDNWPLETTTVPTAAPTGSDQRNAQTLLETLVESQLVTTQTHSMRQAASVPIKQPSVTLIDTILVQTLTGQVDPDQRPIRISTAVHFVLAWLMGMSLLRFRSLEHVVAHVRKRKARGAPTSRPSTHDTLRQLVWSFRRLRPFFYSAKDHCLLDSLVLMQFLAFYRPDSTWVFGVKTSPFGAHCWIQEGSFILNDTIDHANKYSPILAV